jgi:hypothetical protein
LDRYVPTYVDYSQLRRKFWELVKDFRLQETMCGVKDFKDLRALTGDPSMRESMLSRKKEAALIADHLQSVIDRMDALVDEAGAQALVDSWPGLLNVLESHSGDHESFEPLRAVAKAWEVDVWEALIDPSTGRPATGPGSYLTYPFESFQTAFPDAYVRAQQKWARLRPTKEQVAGEMEPTTLSESGLQRHIRQYRKLDPEHIKWPPPI